MSDKENVQAEPVSTEEPVSKEAEEKKEEQPKEQPFSDEQEARIQQMVAQAKSSAEDAGRRALQSEQDRNRNAERRAKSAESQVNAYETSFGSLDEETRKEVELAKYRELDKHNQASTQEDTQRQQETALYQRMNEQVYSNLDALGIARDDKRLDWGTGSQDYVEARSRLDVSVSKILSSDKKVADEKRDDDLKKFKSDLRKELNLDSDIPSGSGEGGDDSDAAFKKGIGDGSLPLSKENMKRAKGLGIA